MEEWSIIYSFLFFADACLSTTTYPYSSTEPNLSLNWPETPIGAVAQIPCPCTGRVALTTAMRQCDGDFLYGGRWQEPATMSCVISNLAQQLCHSPNVRYVCCIVFVVSLNY